MKTVSIFWLTCLVFAVTPLFTSISGGYLGSVEQIHFPGWPQRFQHYRLQEIQMDERTVKAFSAFPGEVAAFESQQERWIFRWITLPSRQLHHASHCFRASGYEIQKQTIWMDSYEIRWGTFDIVKGNRRFRVYEQIREDRSDGVKAKIWTDVSSWYWDASLGMSSPPWLAVTRVREIYSDTNVASD